MDDKIYEIERLTHEQIRQHISERPAVIIPIGGCEPFGDIAALGVETVCAKGVAAELSRRCGILSAPVIPVGCSTPFTAFSGAAGVKPRTFINMLGDITRAYICQGIKKIILISAAPFNKEPAEEAIARLLKAYPKTEAMFFDINTVLCDERKLKDRDRVDRDDALLLSLYMYLRGEKDFAVRQDRPNDLTQYRPWKKRGMDPQKFRKFCPDGLLLSGGDVVISYENGRDYFERVVGAIKSFYGDGGSAPVTPPCGHTVVKSKEKTFTAISIGSNLGDREYYIDEMERELRTVLTDVRMSPLMETAPVGVLDVQPPYLNKIITGNYSGTPRQLLDACLSIESKLGRERKAPKGARTADVDILLFGDMVIDDLDTRPHTLVVPHPELLNRRFCIEGLMSIDPHIIIPPNRTIGEIYKDIFPKLSAQNIYLR